MSSSAFRLDSKMRKHEGEIEMDYTGLSPGSKRPCLEHGSHLEMVPYYCE